MSDSLSVCPNCGKPVTNGVLYKCVRCFTIYCIQCDHSKNGKSCPKCGMGPRIIIDKSS